MAKRKPDFEIIKQGNEEVIRIDANSWSYSPSIEDSGLVMANAIDRLVQVPSVSRIIFNQRKNYEYGYKETQMLVEIANLYNHLTKQKKVLSLELLGVDDVARKHATIKYVVFNLLRTDPIGAYVEVKRLLREERIKLKKTTDFKFVQGIENYLSLLTYVLNLLEQTELIKLVKDNVSGYVMGDRNLYRQLFRVNITPDFMFTKLMARIPIDGEIIDSYSFGDTDINVYKVKDDIKFLYHVNPPEFKLTEDEYMLVNLARSVLAEHKPREEEFLEPDKMRTTFFNIGKDLLMELSSTRKLNIEYERIEMLADILVRYTVGFGMIELLLQDPKIHDVVINSPVGQTKIFIVHEEYGECFTNIIPSSEDGESWATKFRLLSGRPLDEANPVLDTELVVPGGRARVAVIGKPLSPGGLGYAFRRHRDMPWTLPLFVSNRMINSMCAGILNFLIDGARTILVAGTRSSGKTSFLGSILVEIMRKYRIISIEDSVTKDSELLIKRNGKFERTTIGNLIDDLINKYGCWYNLSEAEILGNDENIELYSMDKKGKIKLSKVSKFIRHKVKKPIYEIVTRTGRKIKVTGDHSLFGLNRNAKISEIKANKLGKGSFIAVPRFLQGNLKDLKLVNLLDYLDKINKGFFVGTPIKEFLKKNKYEVRQFAKEHNYTKSTPNRWIRKGIVPVKVLKDLYCLGFKLDGFEGAYYKSHICSKALPVLLELDKTFLTLMGLWIADGCYDSSSVIFSVVEEENRNVVRKFADKYGFDVKMHSDAFSLMINSSTLKYIMREILELKGNAYTKRISQWIYNLSREQLAFVLKGIYSGDGHVSKKEIAMNLSSLDLLKDIQTILLQFGIILRIGKLRKDKTYNSSISTLRDFILFRDLIGILPRQKKERLTLLCNKISTKDTTDVMPLCVDDKNELCSMTKLNSHDYVTRNNKLGRKKLNSVLQKYIVENELVNNLKILIDSDLFWDEIKEIKKTDFEGYVYDVSVPKDESFITNNVVAHNTMELPVNKLRKLGYNIQSMKVRSAVVAGGTEISADEGIRTALRLGDSSLIIGEVRSLEAKALYEAMRIGALANVVAGTIHGDSPYGVYDRVVNDLKVPKTSFKATDLIVICNPVKSPDGLHTWKRVVKVTEVRKHWQEDPLVEKGFVDLMVYNSKTDTLEPTAELINGDSEIIKNIAGNVKEWAGDWNSVWENIMLRSKMKQVLVDYALSVNNKKLLEADFVIESNDMFHKISEEVIEKFGVLNLNEIYKRWDKWLKTHG